MTSKTNTTDRAAAPPVRYRARDTSGRQVEGSSVDRVVADLLAHHRHRAVLTIDDLRIVRRPDREREDRRPIWFVYDSLMGYLDDDSDEVAYRSYWRYGPSRWWATVGEIPAESPAASPASEFAPAGDAAISIAMTLDQCAQAAANYGIDLRCPRCASVFYAGHGVGDCGEACATSAAQVPDDESGLAVLGLEEICATPIDWSGTDLSAAQQGAAQRWIGRLLSAWVARRALVNRIRLESSR